jgi:hypothetical protein
MPEICCGACGAVWHSPPLVLPEVRCEVASLVRNRDTITALRRLREETRLSLGDAKAVVHHISSRSGHCHRCGAGLFGESPITCLRCDAVNYDW